MAFAALQKLTAAMLNDAFALVRPKVYKSPSGSLILTTSWQVITGATLTIVTQNPGAVWVAEAKFQVECGDAGGSSRAEGGLFVGGSQQSDIAIWYFPAVGGTMISQHWTGSFAGAGSHSFDIRGKRTGSTGEAHFDSQTNFMVTIYEAV